MTGIEQATKLKMALAFGMSAVLFAIPAAMIYRTSPSTAVATMLTMPTLFSLFPWIGLWSEKKRLQQKEARLSWRAAYKASPESHLLQLTDTTPAS